jgi:hypothetical protein
MSCLVTGCALVLRGEPDTSLWGDMHAVAADTFIFNAALDLQTGEALRIQEPLNPHARIYFVHEWAEVFERRGILIFPAGEVGWNQALADYLGLEGPRNV